MSHYSLTLARSMSDREHALMIASADATDSEAHSAASRALYAISATSGTVPADMADRWASEESAIASKIGCPLSAHTATVLRELAMRLRKADRRARLLAHVRRTSTSAVQS